jgi:hypothetical protein
MPTGPKIDVLVLPAEIQDFDMRLRDTLQQRTRAGVSLSRRKEIVRRIPQNPDL